jgi:hypothetical protein
MNRALELRLFVDAHAGDELEQVLVEGGAEVRETRQLEDPSPLKFDVAAAVEIVSLVNAIAKLAPLVSAFVKRRDRRVIIQSPFGRIEVTPNRDLSEDEVRELFQRLVI